MKNVWLIARRELYAIFSQPIAYIFAFAILSITGLIFGTQLTSMVLQPGRAPIEIGGTLQLFIFLFLFVGPAVTMRLLAEEQRSGTMELLMTLPIRDGEVVVGKWLAAFIFFLATTLITLIYPFILINYGNPDMGTILTSYLGVLLAGSGLIGVGILASSMTESQIVAFFIAFVISLLLYLADLPAQAGQLNELGNTIFNELAFRSRMDSFFRGLIIVKDLIYFVALTAICLFAATRILESRRWR